MWNVLVSAVINKHSEQQSLLYISIAPYGTMVIHPLIIPFSIHSKHPIPWCPTYVISFHKFYHGFWGGCLTVYQGMRLIIAGWLQTNIITPINIPLNHMFYG